MMRSQNDRAVSPVIGVALMIALTIILGALVALGGLDLVQDFGENPDAQVSFDEDVADPSLDIIVTEVDHEVNEIEARGTWQGDDDTTISNPEVGSEREINNSVHGLDHGDRVTVVAIDTNSSVETEIGSYTMTEER